MCNHCYMMFNYLLICTRLFECSSSAVLVCSAASYYRYLYLCRLTQPSSHYFYSIDSPLIIIIIIIIITYSHHGNTQQVKPSFLKSTSLYFHRHILPCCSPILVLRRMKYRERKIIIPLGLKVKNPTLVKKALLKQTLHLKRKIFISLWLTHCPKKTVGPKGELS